MSEFINGGDEPSDEKKKNNWLMVIIAILVIVIIIILIVVFMSSDSGSFLGSLPARSDVGVSKFDLQKEIDYINDIQMNNLGSI